MEDEESLETSTLISEFPDSVQTEIDDLLSDGVVTSSVVVGSILLSSDELFRVEELSVGSSSYFINNSGFQIEKDGSRNMFSRSSLTAGEAWFIKNLLQLIGSINLNSQ